MSFHVLLTRPLGNCEATKQKLEDSGVQVSLAPLLIHEVLTTPLPADDFDCLIVTSVHAVTALAGLHGRDKISVFVTGAATQQAVLNDGWKNVINVEGGALDVVTAISTTYPTMRHILYPCAEQTAHNLFNAFKKMGIKCSQWPVYRMNEAMKFPHGVKIALQEGEIDAVLFYSARTAKVFSRIANNSVPASTKLFAMSEEIAAALGEPLASKTHYPDKKTETALLSLLDRTKALTP